MGVMTDNEHLMVFYAELEGSFLVQSTNMNTSLSSTILVLVVLIAIYGGCDRNPSLY